MNETIFCTNIVCEMKSVNRTTSLVNAYCEFNGSRTDIMRNFEILAKSSSNRYYPGLNSTTRICDPAEKKMTSIFYYLELFFNDSLPNIQSCPSKVKFHFIY